MFSYIIRRLLLIIPTFFGTTLLVFFILQLVPSGPFEKAVMQIKQAKMQTGETSSGTSKDNGSTELSQEVLEKLKREYGLDKSILTRYLIWLGFAKKELEYKENKLNEPFRYTIQEIGQGDFVPVSLQKWIIATIENEEIIVYSSNAINTNALYWKSSIYEISP